MGKIVAICTSPSKGTPKENIHRAEIIEDFGIKGDAHAGKWHRQVSLLALEEIEAFRKRGAIVEYGAFGENMVVSGYNLKELPIGTRFCCKDVILELTQVGKECHHGCAIFQAMGDCIMPREGVFCRVIRGGEILEGDEFFIIDRDFVSDSNGDAL